MLLLTFALASPLIAGQLGKTENERPLGPHRVTPALQETTKEKEWGYENRDESDTDVGPYLGDFGWYGKDWDDLWWYVNNRIDALGEQISMNHGFIVIKPDYSTGVVGKILLFSPTGSNKRKEQLLRKGEDFKSLDGSLTGDGLGYWDVRYNAKLYVKVGASDSHLAYDQVGAYAYGRLGISIQGQWKYEHGGAMRSNDPEEFAADYCKSMTIADDGSFTDETAIGTMKGGTYSECHPGEGDPTLYDGGGIGCEADVYIRKIIKLSGSTKVTDPALSIVYKSYGWIYVVDEATYCNTWAAGEVQHEKLWYTYLKRTHFKTEKYDEDGELISSELEPEWSGLLFLEEEVEKESSTAGNPPVTTVKYFVKERYADYKDDGFWNVAVEPYDHTDPQKAPLLIHSYEFK